MTSKIYSIACDFGSSGGKIFLSKFENDIKNDMGKTAQSDIEEKVKDYNFTIFDYILFPTVETTSEDVPATNTDGSYKYAMGEKNGDLRQFTKQMNAALNGRGGGKPFFVQGSVQASEEKIRAFFAESEHI